MWGVIKIGMGRQSKLQEKNVETNIFDDVPIDIITRSIWLCCVCLKLRCIAAFVEDNLTKNSMPMHDSETQFLFVFVCMKKMYVLFLMVDQACSCCEACGVHALVLMLWFISKFEEHEDKNITDAFRT